MASLDEMKQELAEVKDRLRRLGEIRDRQLTDEEAASLERDSLLGYRSKRLVRKARARAGRLKAGVRRIGR